MAGSGIAAMKCNKCTKAATLHITEVLDGDQYDEVHLCEECAHKYLYEPHGNKHSTKTGAAQPSVADDPALPNRECPNCGIKFVEFRNSGRLGCPHDYDAFREELTPLLESIHGETRHCGKMPRRQDHMKQTLSELVLLRKQLLQAVNRENYEEAAELRDRIRRLEES
ncbi:MAG TPA: UvrB/UvrC motif-containing protein [Gemmataceae bacterium]|nr:UvrB/UvrC motif-containing protein [Gemmataceae bacterium]